jgi:hypothetical protein
MVEQIEGADVWENSEILREKSELASMQESPTKR